MIRDPGLPPQIWKYPSNKRDDIGRVYLKLDPIQPLLGHYQPSGLKNHQKHFEYSWFNKFPSWMEYSEIKHCTYYFCLLKKIIKLVMMTSQFIVFKIGKRRTMENVGWNTC